MVSPRNPRVKRLTRLAHQPRLRRDEGVFVVEGARLVADALDADLDVEAVFAEEGATASVAVERASATGVPIVVVPQGGLASVVSTATAQPVAAVVSTPAATLADLAPFDLVVVLVGVADPGNVGTLVRTAEAAGGAVVVCGNGAADPFAPKVVRASAGSVFRVPIVFGLEAVEALDGIGRDGRRRVATVASGGVPYDQADLTGRVAVVLGNEAHGLPRELDPDRGDRLDLAISIPMDGRVESVNVAMAGTVVCFEAARQRRAGRSR